MRTMRVLFLCLFLFAATAHAEDPAPVEESVRLISDGRAVNLDATSQRYLRSSFRRSILGEQPDTLFMGLRSIAEARRV